MIEKAQQPDGYLIIYFTVVDKEGRFKNLRDMHEMCKSHKLLHEDKTVADMSRQHGALD
jgi:DUF1680 family protein